MKLFLTAQSERGKAITKSGNEFIEIEIRGEDRRLIGFIGIKPYIKGYRIAWKYSPDVSASEMANTTITGN
jgi:hypothetical protein